MEQCAAARRFGFAGDCAGARSGADTDSRLSREAVWGCKFRAPTALSIAKLDRQRFDVEPTVFKPEYEIAPVNELLCVIEGLDASEPLDLDSAIQAAGNLLLPVGVREFLQWV